MTEPTSGTRPRSMVRKGTLALIGAALLIVVTHFPYTVDKPLTAEDLEKNRKYYAEAYKKEDASGEPKPESEYETKYIRMATQVAEAQHIKEQVAEFAAKYGLQKGAVLDIGSGRGYLQDVVENYTGLDISSSVGRFYHKKFVQGSATAMPFADNTFDGGWSIWVLEHVPNPEHALLELRRVMKNNAVFFLYPAWNSTAWAAEGYEVRPYSDFGWQGKLMKASVPVRSSLPFKLATRVPVRLLRRSASWFGPTRLHYRLLEPNYKEYWVPDSDALNDFDRYETMLWHQSRGDECLNCEGLAGSALMNSIPLIIRIRK